MEGGEVDMAEDDRRKHPRYRIHFEIQISPESSSENDFQDTVLLRDISDGGLSFITKNPGWFYAGQRLKFELHHRNYLFDLRLDGTATVIWLKHCDHSMDQAFVGVELDEIIDASRYLVG